MNETGADNKVRFRGSHALPTSAERLAPGRDTRNDGPTLLTYDQAADLLNVSTSTLRRITEAGDIPHILIGQRSVRFHRDDVDGYIDQRRTT